MNRPAFLCVALLLVSGASIASAQDEPPNPFGDDTSSDQGEPDAGAGPVFTDGVDTQCETACRPGTTCVHGQCVSLCNPACGPGLQCSPQGICVTATVGAPPGAGAPGFGPPAAPREPISGSPAVVRGAVAMGLAAVAAGLGVGAWATEDADPTSVAPIVLSGVGAAATVAGVFVARSGSSLVRREGGATGIGFFRVTTWIFMVGGLLFDIIGIGLSATNDGTGTFGSNIGRLHLVGGVAGALASLSAGADSLVAGLQQNELHRAAAAAREQTRWLPRIGRMRDLSGQQVPALSWSGVF